MPKKDDEETLGKLFEEKERLKGELDALRDGGTSFDEQLVRDAGVRGKQQEILRLNDEITVILLKSLKSHSKTLERLTIGLVGISVILAVLTVVLIGVTIG